MARNIEKDKREEVRRREQLLKCGFELFSKNGIESVSLQSIATMAEVGVVTLYNYYQNKTNLVIAISADIWKNFWRDSLKKHSVDELMEYDIFQLVEYYCDLLIDLYKTRPEVLRFSGNYKTYICREGASSEQLSIQLHELSPVEEIFKRKYDEAREAGTIRTDITLEHLYTTTSITMLALAERYAMGIVWTKTADKDYIIELNMIKEMLLGWMRK